MCDFAVGLSRQLNGSVIPSERKLKHLVVVISPNIVFIIYGHILFHLFYFLRLMNHQPLRLGFLISLQILIEVSPELMMVTFFVNRSKSYDVRGLLHIYTFCSWINDYDLLP